MCDPIELVERTKSEATKLLGRDQLCFLLQAAETARKNGERAGTHHGGYYVGAAVLVDSASQSRIFTGCNTKLLPGRDEEALALRCCAEQIAVMSAVTQCPGMLKAIVIIGKQRHAEAALLPCDTCRRFLLGMQHVFAPDALIICQWGTNMRVFEIPRG